MLLHSRESQLQIFNMADVNNSCPCLKSSSKHWLYTDICCMCTESWQLTIKSQVLMLCQTLYLILTQRWWWTETCLGRVKCLERWQLSWDGSLEVVEFLPNQVAMPIKVNHAYTQSTIPIELPLVLLGTLQIMPISWADRFHADTTPQPSLDTIRSFTSLDMPKTERLSVIGGTGGILHIKRSLHIMFLTWVLDFLRLSSQCTLWKHICHRWIEAATLGVIQPDHTQNGMIGPTLSESFRKLTSLWLTLTSVGW